MRENFHLKVWQSSALIFLVLPVILAIFGPFGTYSDLTLSARLIYWTVLVIGIGSLMFSFNAAMLANAHRLNLPKPALIAIATGAAAVPSTAIVLILHGWMRPHLADAGFARVLGIWLEIWVLGGLISLIEFFRQGFWAAQQDQESKGTDLVSPLGMVSDLSSETDLSTEALGNSNEIEPALPEPTRLHERLPPEMQSPLASIISLSMQDHYVEITTDVGQHLVLMRFSDAMAELDALEGLRVHRSHWVARDHMVSLRKAGNRTMLKLSDDRELPVSQTYKAAVQEQLSRQLMARAGVSGP